MRHRKRCTCKLGRFCEDGHSPVTHMSNIHVAGQENRIADGLVVYGVVERVGSQR